jgi:chorismate-pyruvate lyase
LEGCHEAMNQPESLLDPLDQFYFVSGVAVPKATKIEAECIPEPYRSLLVHDNDMTSTLEAEYRQRIHIRLISREVTDDVLRRQVVLVLDSDERPVEFGAIRIQLNQMPPEARQRVLENKLPLGRVLQDFFIQHNSQPVAYFEVEADSRIGEALQTPGAQRLYGRRNRLLTPSGEVLAEVVEILPPSE